MNRLSRLLWTPLLAWVLALPAQAGIADPVAFLDLCPTLDPMYPRWRADFVVLRNGRPVESIECTEPVSAMPDGRATDELRVLQALRLMYYAGRARDENLPWTTLSMYAWLASNVAGFDISDTAESSSCCKTVDGRYYITLRANDRTPAFARNFVAGPYGVLSMVALMGHEGRHRDGFGHNSACGIAGGCDQAYDEADLSPYGIQYWLHAAWLTGRIDVGLACASATARADLSRSLLVIGNSYRSRFARAAPPELTAPAQPGGECRKPAPHECVLDWAEVAFESYLGTFGGATLFADPFDYRHYAARSSFLGVSRTDQHVYYLGPASAQQVVDLGTLSAWRVRSGCST